MSLKGKDLINIDEVTTEEIEEIFFLADEMLEVIKTGSGEGKNKIMATLFFESSTRTRFSFESAMHRLGGNVISFADAKVSSVIKGESIADTTRVVGEYSDIIVIRHPWEGAARIAADHTDVPVINAGDGSHEHPTQTLCDLYTLKKEKGKIEDLSVALCGDLKYGRTVHSLAYGLAKFGVNIICIPGEDLEMPDYVLEKMRSEYDYSPIKAKSRDVKSLIKEADVVYITPSKSHQLSLFTDKDLGLPIEVARTNRIMPKIDALYVTRVQKERFLESNGNKTKGSYPVVDKKLLKKAKFKEVLVMHPLPRVDEVSYEIDEDPRSMYFRQAARGLPIRMAITALLLGTREVKSSPHFRGEGYQVYRNPLGVRCSNERCVSTQETQGYLIPEFYIINHEPLTLRCVYCEHMIHPQYVGNSRSGKYFHSNSAWVKWIGTENLIIFNSREEADRAGLHPYKLIH
jgi:aspartate carbamoyltransferase catalytic subunit